MGLLGRIFRIAIASGIVLAGTVESTAAQTAAPSLPAAAPTAGPVLVDGKSTYVLAFDHGNTKIVSASQEHAPPGRYFVATVGTICIGAVNVSGSAATIPTGGITSSGPFTFTRVGNTAGCAVSISSSAGGPPAVVVFQ